MKDYKFDYKVTPAIVGEKICVFDVQMLYKRFFRKKVLYSGQMIVERNMETWGCAEFVLHPEVNKHKQRIQSISTSQADFIFKAYDWENESKHKEKHKYMYEENQNRAWKGSILYFIYK